ncbi:MAG: Jag N-terminal domain-containing protein [Bacilli bacterium]|nr:Jag N-terminal domain-containing protein [Bacilli bacterium]
MKEFTGKTVDEAVKVAADSLGVDSLHLVYEVKEEKKSLFKKSATILVYEDEDAAHYAEEYLKSSLKALGVDIETEAVLEDGIIKISIDSDANPIIIGKGGRTLQAFNEITKFAVSTKFRKRFRILLDVGGYKEDKYARIERMVTRVAKSVLRDHVDATLDPMTPDERRVVHNTLSSWEHIKTESSGEGADRAVTIKYVD